MNEFESEKSEISDEDLKDVFESVKYGISAAKDLLYPPTYFEFVTAMAFLYFRDRVKFAILEVGLGGRLDATNVVNQDVSVITSIGLDHQEYLGTTIEAIAAEKAGIIKDREPVVIGPAADLQPIREKAGARLIRAAEIKTEVRSLGSGYFEIDIGRHRNLRPRLPGRHQIENVQIAVRAAECLGWPNARYCPRHQYRNMAGPARADRQVSPRWRPQCRCGANVGGVSWGVSSRRRVDGLRRDGGQAIRRNACNYSVRTCVNSFSRNRKAAGPKDPAELAKLLFPGFSRMQSSTAAANAQPSAGSTR